MREGKFKASVIDVSFGHSTHAGTPYIAVNLIVDCGDGNERTTGNIWLTDRNAKGARRSLKAIGFNPDAHELAELQANPGMLKGNECEIDIQSEEFRDRTILRVQWINALQTKGSPDELKDITKMLRESKKQETSKKEEIQEAEIQETDLPF